MTINTKKFVLPILLLTMNFGYAQKTKSSNYGSVTSAIGASQVSISLDYFHYWNIGKHDRFSLAAGGRFTSYFGNSQYYATAPAKLTTGSTGPGVIFKEIIPSNLDSVLIKSPQVNSLNLAINIGYRIVPKLQVGFNIDLVGFSFGNKVNGTYINAAQQTSVSANPTSFNVLGIGDNDRGSLNSEFYARYYFDADWGLKIGFQYLFTEYTTSTEVQQFPEPNDRFRNKSSMLSVGVTHKFK